MAGRWPQAVLFDLDGTLVDSAPDIHAALNETLASYGEPPFTLEAVTRMVGRGVPVLIERAWEGLGKSIDPAERERVVARFLAIYEPRATELTTLTAGASEATRALVDAGTPIGVVTNKPEAATREILSHFGLSELMQVVVGGDAGPAKKPEPGLLLLACERLGLAVGQVVFVGDSENDVAAAKAAGMAVVVLRGGYTSIAADALGADAVVDRLDALGDVVSTLRPASA
ncbi:putative phosphoglycolate phosphatase [Aurantimonas manganoxydans SI85-9A1]|uniref:Phosphoglycolate phosphatase n=1 Tax=Aurantimonas manganoxydans (strain ATCC BAA-1229 / DSM 21871 / SI85-9A1) TaxID=287752 RepID=Q1YFR6_AURMS|nr:phosphoglycolate phosphatase [Aurantimonas manganoxydans]EAS48907.1 putative phosphoglycolate phosphatase [Aurantimonas manganoxydans SI85-9A1]